MVVSNPPVVAPRSLTSADNDGNLGTFNSGYRGMSGTSMATPVVAGGLASSGSISWTAGISRVGPTQRMPLHRRLRCLKAVLLAGTVEVTDEHADYKNEGKFPNNTQGWGFPISRAPFTLPVREKNLWVVDQTPGIHTGDQIFLYRDGH